MRVHVIKKLICLGLCVGAERVSVPVQWAIPVAADITAARDCDAREDTCFHMQTIQHEEAQVPKTSTALPTHAEMRSRSYKLINMFPLLLG